jgi:hypothetical protein
MPALYRSLVAALGDGGFAWARLAFAQFATWVESHSLLAALLFLVALAWLAVRIETRQRVLQNGRREAERRAMALLREHLTVGQHRQLLASGYLEVPSRLYPWRNYRIPYGPARVQVYEAEQKVAELCVVARDPVPEGDMVLTHKWMIEADEEGYLATANWMGWPSNYGRRRLETPPVWLL